MSLKYCLLATEGPHDQAAITKLLQLAGLEKFKGAVQNLDPFWEGFIPKHPKGGNLYKRLDMPSIVTSRTHSIAVYWGEGSELTKNLIAIITNQKRYAEQIQAFGLIIDADKGSAGNIAKQRAEALKTIFPMLSPVPGAITESIPRTGIYILPNNERAGTLDSLLVDCATLVYPQHRGGATHFLDSLESVHTEHLNDFAKEKAIVASIVSILRPGMANTSSIAQDNWISEQTIQNNAEIKLLSDFLATLLQLQTGEVAPDNGETDRV